MAFRKRECLGKHEKWFQEENKVEVVNSYTYLGYTFTTKLGVCQGVSFLAAKGKKKQHVTVRVLRNFSEMTRQTFFKTLDAQIQPIVLCCSAVWGLQRVDVVEKVYTLACNRFFNVPLKTPNKCVQWKVLLVCQFVYTSC